MDVRCPQCHSPIELAEDAELSAIACPFVRPVRSRN